MKESNLQDQGFRLMVWMGTNQGNRKPRLNLCLFDAVANYNRLSRHLRDQPFQGRYRHHLSPHRCHHPVGYLHIQIGQLPSQIAYWGINRFH